MKVIEETADQLAIEALEAMEKHGDEKILDRVSEIIGADSMTTQEAYLTSVRVRKAAMRARKYLHSLEAKNSES
ncbi:MAG TPA: hypothetical protein ENJ91_08125 [Rhodobacteraceae bacterium]|nr:hypothetical protein [Paracoccaceae bacterium]